MSKTKERIRDSQLRYKQNLGQNFIYDEDLLYSLVEASGVTEEDDVLEIRHSIKNRRTLAEGAVVAAEFLCGKKGIYTMEDLF